MLRTAKDLYGLAIHATDGDIGSVVDLYFDDESWVVRYLVVDTGAWLPGRRVLLSPLSLLRHLESDQQSLPVALTKEQVRNSPDIDTAQPVSRKYEAEFSGYYGYPFYWGIASPPPVLPSREDAARTVRHAQAAAQTDAAAESHIRSAKTIAGYHVHATDGAIGHLDDFLVDDQTWAIRYGIVDTSNWIGGTLVLVARQWVSEMRWADSEVHVDINREAIKSAPPFDRGTPLDRGQEERLFRHYLRTGYWSGTPDT